MQKKSIAQGIVLALLVSVLAPPVFAKGAASRIEIQLPDRMITVDLEDVEDLLDLSIGQLEDFSQPISTPVDVGASMVLTRYFQDDQGNFIPFDRVAYFANGKGPGYVLYLGIVNGWSEYDGHWFSATPEGEQALKAILTANGVQMEAESRAKAAAPNATFGIVAFLGLAGGWVLGRRKPVNA